MSQEISLIYSDGAMPEDHRINIYVTRDLIAQRYSDSPSNVDDYDPFDYNFGIFCHNGEEIARKRIQSREDMKNNNRR